MATLVNKAEIWWRRRSNDPIPNTVAEAVELAQAGSVACTKRIKVRSIAGEQIRPHHRPHHRARPDPIALLSPSGFTDDEVPF